MNTHILKALLLTVLTAFPPLLKANGIGIIDGLAGIYLTIVESETYVEVTNQIAVTTTKQVLVNNTGEAVVIKYGFPLGDGANPISLRWNQFGFWEEASISANEQDNSIPGSGGSGSIHPNLNAYLGPNPLLVNLLDTIPPDSSITIELTYVELLPYFLGIVSYNYPNDLSLIQNTPLERQYFHYSMTSDREIVSVDLLDLSSTDILDPYDASIEYEAFETAAVSDYLLEYELSSDGLGLYQMSTNIPDSLLYCDDFGAGFVSLIIEPESNVNTEVIEKNFTLVIDRSGSMSGDKIVQARQAASFIVNNLNPGDRFNIIDFSSDVNSLFGTHVDFSVSNQQAALYYIDNIVADGGTNIASSLTTAVSEFQTVSEDKANIILFFTDGNPTVGIQDTQGILDAVTDQVNQSETSIFMFTFGIGDDVNKPLLILLAEQNNGLVEFVEDADLNETLTTFFLSVNNPVLINTEISFDPPLIDQIYPYPFPNLYKGQQLIISGRYEEFGTVNMHISGQAFNVPVSYDFPIHLSDSMNVELSFLPKIWAKQKIDVLGLQYFLANDAEQNLIQEEIDTTSICYGVISVDFSSFQDNGGGIVEVEETRLPDEKYSITAAPNPFSGELVINITAPDKLDLVEVCLYDATGRLIRKQSQQANDTKAQIVLSGLQRLAPGVYWCQIRIGHQIRMIKVIKF